MPPGSESTGARQVLLIDDDPPFFNDDLGMLSADLNLSYSRTSWVSFAFESLGSSSAELLILVVAQNRERPEALFRWLKDHPLTIPTLALFPGGVQSDLVEKTLAAVDDFIAWPIRPEEWRYRLTRVLRLGGSDSTFTRDRLTDELGLAQLVGEDPAFLRMIHRIPLAARSDSPVLITGETGTGKELCARAIHHLGRRRGSPFIPVDCGALPDHLFENEFFGHSRGAFTDAGRDQRGLVALSEGGTLFLDEVDSLSLTAQVKLLRFLQERTYKPLGAERFMQADVNVIAATNRSLETLVRDKQFREDLYFRLNVIRFHLAPLRERRGDVPILARHFVESICAETGSPCKTLAPLALRQLTMHPWPGNVRELFNVLQRAILFSEGAVIQAVDVANSGRELEPGHSESFGQARSRVIEVFERLYVEDVLRRNGGNVTRAAREACKERRAFGRLVKKYSIRRSV
jgi:two-component system response regulator GlrR